MPKSLEITRSPARRFLQAIKRRMVGGDTVLSPELQRRVAMTVGCRDTDVIPKVADAGRIVRRNGVDVQVMHEGTVVRAGGYEGEWTIQVIRSLRGHHEPQEELVFHHLVEHARSGTLMVELGAFWAYYTNWYLGAVGGSEALCIEPDASRMACGQENLQLNGRTARWELACVGREHADSVPIRRGSDNVVVTVPCHSMDSILRLIDRRPVEMLHIDVQGAELPFLESLGVAARAGLLRFVLVSTHHASISGSETTHQDCLRQLGGLGAVILCDHTVEESFSGDGFIAASFHAGDVELALPPVSRNVPRASLFGPDGRRQPGMTLADTDNGPMLVYSADSVIGRSLRERGVFEETAIASVVRFLRRECGFQSRLFVDIGANIGTHLLRAVRDGMFAEGVGVEMDAANFRLLTCNVVLNDLQQKVRLSNVAVSDRAGIATMEQSTDNYGDHRLRAAGGGASGADAMRVDQGREVFAEHARPTRQVETVTLDTMEASAGFTCDRRTLIWIDTQGHEGHVLEGGHGIFAREDKPFVVVEFWPYGLERSGGRTRLFKFLKRCRAVYHMSVTGWESRGPASLADVERLYDRMLEESRAPHTDLLCVV